MKRNVNLYSLSTNSFIYLKRLALIVCLAIGVSGFNYAKGNGKSINSNAQQEQKTITGSVSDEQGSPIPGLTVLEKGTTNGTVTDFDGNYSINVDPSSKVLVFSFVGMETQEIAIKGQASINVVMESIDIGLEEVVAVGYATQKRVNLTGAVATIQSDELVKSPVANTTNAIAGRLPGVITKQTSGEPGSDGTSINIRGFGSPLIIVDGIERNFHDINAEEIESMSVLKDAAAAIYGARAGNGVILITTKRGSGMDTKFDYKNSFSFQGVTDYPGFVNSGQYAELYNEAELFDGADEGSLSFSDEDIANYYAGAPGYPNSDWWRATIRNWSPQQQHSLSLRGGSEKVKFYGFMGYTHQEGMYKSGDNVMDRFNLRSNIDVKVNENLDVALDVSGKVENLSSPVASTNEVFTNIFNSLPLYPTSLPDMGLVPFSGKEYQNPMAITTRDISGYDDKDANKYEASLKINYKVPFIRGLSAKGRFDYYGKTTFRKKWEKAYDVYTYDTEAHTYAIAGSQPLTSLREDFDRSRMLTGQLSINYNRTFNDAHKVNGLLVYEVIDQKGNDFWAMRQEYLTSIIDQLFASGIENQDLSGKAWENGRISYIGRLNYGYKGKYLLEGSFRYDGSNRFAAENRWGFFPSVSAAWRISEEDFMQNDWLDNFKLRASVSQTGYDDTGKFQFLTGYEFGKGYIINDMYKLGIKNTGVPNPDITWEEMTTYNSGFDLSILKSKLSAEFDIFYRLRQGMLAKRDKSLPNTIGATLPAENLNSQSNRGFELTLGHTNRVGKLKYSVRGMFSWAKAKWEDYDEPFYTDNDDIRIKQKTGNWTSRRFGYKAIGFFQTQEEIDAWPLDQDQSGNASLRPGDIKYLDLDEDGVLTWRDKMEIGRGGTPLAMYGLNVDLNYKAFDFSMLWQGAAEHYIEMTTRNIFESSFPKPFEYMYTERWEPGKTDALYPRASLATVVNNGHDSDFWLKPADYVRLKNISLGVTVPKEIISKIGLSKLRLYVAGNNLFTFSKMSEYGFDPESPAEQSGKYYPQMRTLSCGLNVTF